INSPAGSQLMELKNTPKTSLTDSQKTAVPDTKETFHNEGSWKKTLSGNMTLGTYSTAMCESQRTALGDNEVAFCGSKLATLDRDPVMSFNDDKDPNEDHPVVSVCEQTFKVDLKML
ncbi:hypothetical protein A6R68_00371, partial [Neotoma lepida]